VLPREVGYARPWTLAEALELLGSNDGARPLAGGQTLVNVMKARVASPDALVDLNGLRSPGRRARRRRQPRDRLDDDHTEI
jgi:CO/xanthine dehydrogenase FAD-binding subunit